MRAALGMADARMAWTLAHELPERLLEIERWGFRLIPDPDGRRRHYAGYSCFGTQPRAHGMRRRARRPHRQHGAVLARRFRGLGGEVHPDTTVIDLLAARTASASARWRSTPTGEPSPTGPAPSCWRPAAPSQMFPLSRTPGEITGDGYGMAFRAGAELINLEFMQYMVRPVHGTPPELGGPFWSLNPVVRERGRRGPAAHALPPGVTAAEVFHNRTLHYPFSSRDQRHVAGYRGPAGDPGRPRHAARRRADRLLRRRSGDGRAAPRPQHRPPAPRTWSSATRSSS